MRLSSQARLHDQFVSIDAMTPSEDKSGGRGNDPHGTEAATHVL